MSWDDIPSWSADIAKTILLSVKEKDPHTFYHCLRVGRVSRQLAKAMGLNEFEQAVLEFSGMFHDVGKIGVPDSVLLKPGKLDPAEVEIMKSHPMKSSAIVEPLSKATFFRLTLPGIRYHHERIDGLGYPYGISGEKIPLPARVISVVDTYDAMSYARPYRKAQPLEKVQQELIDFSGTQFDAAIVRVFMQLLPHLSREEDKNEEIAISKILKAA